MNKRSILFALALAILSGLLVLTDNLSRAQNFHTPSRTPFSLGIPQLNLTGITSLEVRIRTTQIHTLKIHIAEPAAEQIGYEKIYTVINAESANTIQTVTAGSSGKVVTLDLERRDLFRLRPGKNVIEISATDSAQRPYYASFVINAAADETTKPLRSAAPVSYKFKGRNYALVIGVSRYKFHEGGLRDLQYAHADSRSIAEFLKTRAGFAESDISYLENENATVENVRAAVNLFLRRAREDDLVFLFVAGHGAQDPFDPKNLYLVLHDSKVTDMPRTAFNMSELQALFTNRLRAKRMVILIDACHSAGVGLAANNSSGRQLVRTENNTFSVYAEKLFTGEGRALLTSSDVNEISEEGENWGGGHGVFTWAILKGLGGVADANRDSVITTGELFDFVSAKVREETKARQNPRALPGTDRDFPLTRVTR